MSAAATSRAPDWDWALSFLSLAGALIASWFLVTGGGRGAAGVEGSIGRLDFSVSSVRRRPLGQLGWEDLVTGDRVHDRDAVFVPPGGSATFVFRDGSKLEVEENSLVILEEQQVEAAPPVSVALLKGSVSGETAGGSLAIKTDQQSTTLQPGSQARWDREAGKGTRVNVYVGKVEVNGAGGAAELEKDQSAELGGGGLQRLTPPKVHLASPAANARYYFHGAPVAIPLELSGQEAELAAAQVEVARDRAFREVASRGPGGQLTFSATAPGSYWWRAASSAGMPVSEARRFVVADDPPPEGISPGTGQTLAFGPKLPVLFAWRPVPGVSRYHLEVSATPDFAQPALSQDVEGEHLRVEPALSEGTYYWRVRSVDDARGETRFSEGDAFRLVLKPLPDAPTLFEPELEVGPAPRKR